jgi:hypothetical protein
MSDFEQLAKETLEDLCNDYPGDAPHRLTMKAAFEIFAVHIISREANERLREHEIKHTRWYKIIYRWE